MRSTKGSASSFFMSGVPQRQQLSSERTPLSSFAPAPSTDSCVPLTRKCQTSHSPSPHSFPKKICKSTESCLNSCPIFFKPRRRKMSAKRLTSRDTRRIDSTLSKFPSAIAPEGDDSPSGGLLFYLARGHFLNCVKSDSNL